MEEKTIYCPTCNKIVKYCTDYVHDKDTLAKFCNECDARIRKKKEKSSGPMVGSSGEFGGETRVSNK
tara:strand:+ start:131 stop:331 length:201 start_codon:yes stop_codon:yes gene_type:complete